MSEVVIETQDLAKKYSRDEFEVIALDHVDIQIHKREFVALMGLRKRKIHAAPFNRCHG